MNTYPLIAILTTPDADGESDVLGHVVGVTEAQLAELFDLAAERSLQLLGLGMRPRPACYRPAFRLFVETSIACEPCSLTAAAEYVAGIVTADVRAEMERAA